MNWTDASRATFQSLCRHYTPALAAIGADPDEVRDDWERHVEHTATEQGLSAITDEHVRGALADLVPAGAAAGVAPPPPVSPAHSGARHAGTAGMALFGVVLPLLALVLELAARPWASTLFNPLPSLWHTLLVASVPIANLALLLDRRRPTPRAPRALAALNGVALGASIYYSLMFLPVMPFCVLAVAMMGLGLIPLSPYFGLIVAIKLRRDLAHRTPAALKPRLTVVLLIVILSLLIPEAPQVATRIGLDAAASPAPERQARGVRFLRRWASDDAILRACYATPREVDSLHGFLLNLFLSDVPRETVRDIYYRVTGTPFNAVRPPELRRLSGGMMFSVDDLDWEQGGDAVAARAHGLWLHESTQDGMVMPRAGVSYTEWTMVFRNESHDQREARARIQLPPGGVVSRLTLWVDGEPREAAFSAKSRVKAAYKRVVQRRRDPVLVTSSGNDEVLMQCFPVPPGGSMKIRFGITAPLPPTEENQATLRIPSIIEHNFGIDDSLTHELWFESLSRLQALAPIALEISPADHGFGLRGRVTTEQLGNGIGLAALSTPPLPLLDVLDARAPGEGAGIHQVLDTQRRPPVDELAIVIDASRRMKPYMEELADRVADGIPDRTTLSIWIAEDAPRLLFGPARLGSPQDRDALRRAIRAQRPAGGCDNLPALSAAWDQAAQSTNSAVLWLHATQPLALSATESMAQRLRRRRRGPPIMDLQLGAGPNRVKEALHSNSSWRSVPCLRGGVEDLSAILTDLANGHDRHRYLRKRTAGPPVPPESDATFPSGTDLHVARLWAFNEILRLHRAGSDAQHAQAMELATTYQLVTPISGAVVLENQQQYEEAGLNPVDPSSVPEVVPEPGTLLLLLAGGIPVLLARLRRRRRR